MFSQRSFSFLCRFGSKEEYMTFMNDFVDRELSSMKTFLQQISVRSVNTFLHKVFAKHEKEFSETHCSHNNIVNILQAKSCWGLFVIQVS